MKTPPYPAINTVYPKKTPPYLAHPTHSSKTPYLSYPPNHLTIHVLTNAICHATPNVSSADFSASTILPPIVNGRTQESQDRAHHIPIFIALFISISVTQIFKK